MGELQTLTLAALPSATGVKPSKMECNWLVNIPLKEYLGVRYDGAMTVFAALGGDRNGLGQKRPRRLVPDAYLPTPYNCLFEYDELQHFTRPRRVSLDHYPTKFACGFPVDEWQGFCDKYCVVAEAKGAAGYRAPKVEFPFQGGRHAQRALFDTLRDFAPPLHGLCPTIRVCEFEFNPRSDPVGKLRELIESRRAS